MVTRCSTKQHLRCAHDAKVCRTNKRNKHVHILTRKTKTCSRHYVWRPICHTHTHCIRREIVWLSLFTSSTSSSSLEIDYKTRNTKHSPQRLDLLESIFIVDIFEWFEWRNNKMCTYVRVSERCFGDCRDLTCIRWDAYVCSLNFVHSSHTQVVRKNWNIEFLLRKH